MNKKISGFVLKIALIVLLVWPTVAGAIMVEMLPNAPRFLIGIVGSEFSDSRYYSPEVKFRKVIVLWDLIKLEGPPFEEYSLSTGQTLHIKNNDKLFFGDIILFRTSLFFTGGNSRISVDEAEIEVERYVYIYHPFPVVIFIMIISVVIIKRKKIITYIKTLSKNNGAVQNPK